MKRRATGKAVGQKVKGESTSSVSPNLPDKRGVTCRYFAIFLLLFVLPLFILWLLPNPIDPIGFEYSSGNDSFPLHVNDHLKKGRRLFENEIIGPEAFAVDKQGNIFSGLADGRIIHIEPSLKTYRTVTRTAQIPFDNCENGAVGNEKQCGRPLGMEFHPHNAEELYVIDSSHGVLKINVVTGVVEILVKKETVTLPMAFPNDLVVLDNGSIFFTDSSYKYSRADHMLEVLECRANGRLLHYNPISRFVDVVLDGLFFPNGLTVSNDGLSLLFAETTRARIRRLPLQDGVNRKVVIFSENLPGVPDNISPSRDGEGYLVGIGATRHSGILDYLAKWPIWRSVVAKLNLMNWLKSVIPHHGLILKLDNQGRIVKAFHDVGGTVVSSSSHILDLGDQLLIGSYIAPYIVALSV